MILGAIRADLSALRRHERVHVRQYERCRAPYRDNAFEVEARRRGSEPAADARRTIG